MRILLHTTVFAGYAEDREIAECVMVRENASAAKALAIIANQRSMK